ncbi:MAG: DUF4331 domain-containing protein [Candidatus Eisenbacteria bacterium]|uniref:DUF4331 domain-containing protein n=1 Tax=Eiseniibacteriota bacterium TaxID=2212470 RepID=A0A538SJQ5_UNCEI|nr:MAG: DUF4331 domain-containing protein [Candidatus Eisenbacteria bacterium]
MRNRMFAAALLALGIGAATAFASSHSEAPGTSKDRLADDTDLYAWVTSDASNAVTIVGNWVPLIEPNSGPNFASFDDEVMYYINIDNVGDAQDNIRYEFTFKTTRANPNTFLYNTGVVTSFDDPDLNVRQTWSLNRIDHTGEHTLATDRPVAPNYVGPKSMPDYNRLAQSTIATLNDGTKIFVGPRDDPFFVDLGAVFDLLTIRKVPGDKGKGVDGVGGFDVMSIVLQIPKRLLTSDGKEPTATTGVIGIYDSAERFATRTINADGSIGLGGPEVQVSRLGNPLVNEVVIPLKDKDKFNHNKPTGDGAFLGYVTDPELPKLFNLIYGLPIPTTPRNDLVAVFLTGITGLNKPANPNQVPCEMLRLNMTIPPADHPKRLGVLEGDIAGFPNGRRLTDDVVDIEERAAAGGYVLTPDFNHDPANDLGDGVDANDVPLLPYFPYVAPPHSPFLHSHHPEQNGNAPRSDHDRDHDHGRPGFSRAGGPKLGLGGRNPGRSSSVLQFTLDRQAHVTLMVYDVQGRAVRTLVDQDAAEGTFRAQWDGRSDDGGDAGKGVFFARLTADGALVASRKVVIE